MGKETGKEPRVTVVSQSIWVFVYVQYYNYYESKLKVFSLEPKALRHSAGSTSLFSFVANWEWLLMSMYIVQP